VAQVQVQVQVCLTSVDGQVQPPWRSTLVQVRRRDLLMCAGYLVWEVSRQRSSASDQLSASAFAGREASTLNNAPAMHLSCPVSQCSSYNLATTCVLMKPIASCTAGGQFCQMPASLPAAMGPAL
jgi:hypothetical protein